MPFFFAAFQATLLLLLLPFVTLVSAQQSGFKYQESIDLAKLVNEVRVAEGLTEIPLSYAVTYTAELHVDNHVWAIDNGKWNNDPACNIHTWYDAPDVALEGYVPCCYTGLIEDADCMWQKMREITASWPLSYPGIGFEIGAAGYPTIEMALYDGWLQSNAHRPVILQYDGWERFTFNALGCGAMEGEHPKRLYFCWFAMRVDPNGSPDFTGAPTAVTDAPAGATQSPTPFVPLPTAFPVPMPTRSPEATDEPTQGPSEQPTTSPSRTTTDAPTPWVRCCHGRRRRNYNRRCKQYNRNPSDCIADLKCWWDLDNPACLA